VTSIRLVPLAEEHVPALLETMRDPDVLRFTRTPDPMPDGWVHDYISRFDLEHRGGWAILDGEEFVGYAVTGPIDREGSEVELGYAVSPWARGRGVATETLRQLTQWAFDQGMQRVIALISVDNAASSRVAAKAGYTFEGVLRSMHHRDDQRVDLESWSILPGELPPT
jgi:RimJ/RimL family protein N-acetyltransferase